MTPGSQLQRQIMLTLRWRQTLACWYHSQNQEQSIYKGDSVDYGVAGNDK